jgi:hypothetical protein
VTPTELQQFLTRFAADRLAIYERHVAGATVVGHYDFNNTYQYVINREETHVSWLQHALLDLGEAIPADPAGAPIAAAKGADGWRSLAGEDSRSNQDFVDMWKPRVEAVTHARHKGMLKVILGEMLEHTRIFDHAAAGRDDLIGTHLAINQRTGVVADTRWME